MSEQTDALLTVQFTGDDDDASGIAEFLALAQAVYTAAWRSGAATPEALIGYLRSLTFGELDALFSVPPVATRLRVARFAHESPLNARLVGVSGALALLAMILSGGKFEASIPISGSLKLELNPLGDGIDKLRRALWPVTAPGAEVSLRFGVKDVTIYLSEDEIVELQLQEDSTAAQGGFQRLLVSLKHRVNRRTGELHLSPLDLDRITRGATRGTGGWQSRLEKVFGRHLRLMASHAASGDTEDDE